MKPELKFGLITGAGICLWTTAEYLLGLHTEHLAIGEYTGYGSSLIPAATLFFLLKGKRDATYDGYLNLGSSIGSGIYTSLIGAMIVYIYMVTYGHFINPGWLDRAIEWKVGQMRDQGLSEIAIRKEITFIRQANTTFGLLSTTLVGITLLGALMATGLTFLLRRWPRSPSA